MQLHAPTNGLLRRARHKSTEIDAAREKLGKSKSQHHQLQSYASHRIKILYISLRTVTVTATVE